MIYAVVGTHRYAREAGGGSIFGVGRGRFAGQHQPRAEYR